MALSNYIKITDTPDIKSIEENNNPEGMQPFQLTFEDYERELKKRELKTKYPVRFVLVNASTNEYHKL
tara:strand:- start:233 stop:436 length:204 start_codon:yes stop_codon:yes gene_type:complete